jgi:hypothetical protein
MVIASARDRFIQFSTRSSAKVTCAIKTARGEVTQSSA